MKVVINRCFGGFGLSKEALEFLGADYDFEYDRYEMRTDAKLIECVEQLGERANGEYSELKIVEVPDDVDWHIEEYDGMETVEEDHRSWY